LKSFHPGGSIRHTLSYLIFISAAQQKETKEENSFFIIFCFTIDNIRMTINLLRMKEQQRREKKKRKSKYSASFALFIFLFIL